MQGNPNTKTINNFAFNAELDKDKNIFVGVENLGEKPSST